VAVSARSIFPVRFAVNAYPGRADTRARQVACTLAAASLLASFSCAGQASPPRPEAAPAGSFDPPTKQVTVDIAPSPGNHNTRGVLVCYYYPRLLIKEHAQDQMKGARLSMVRTEGEPPACRLSGEPGEREIGGDDFLMGVKDDLVFFDTGDTFNGTLGFGVVDSASGKHLFEDWVRYRKTPGGASDLVRAFSTGAGYVLKYMSVTQAECDLHRDGNACWERIRAKLDLKGDATPVCTGYEHIAEMAKAFGTDYFESMVAYPVEVTLSPRPIVESVAGPIACWPAF
jgi:hypothetical protein